MQDEASIPEDILDQQHIQDEDGDVQYATESEATDIVFESEGLTPNNSTSHVSAKKSNDYDNFTKKKTNKANKIKTNDENANKKDEYYDDIAILGDELDTDDEYSVKQSMAMTSGSDAYKKFKRIKPEQNEQDQQKLQQHQQNRKGHQHQEQLSAIVELNERKFNKGPVREMDPEKNSVKNRKTSKYTMKKKQNEKVGSEDYDEENREEKVAEDDYVATATIGDIADNFRNEDEALATDTNHDTKDTQYFDDFDGNVDSDKSNAATAASNILSSQRSISPSETVGPMLMSPIVGPKSKRLNRLRTFNSGDDMQQASIHFDDIKHKSHQKVFLIDDEERSDKNNNQRQRPEIVVDAKFQNDYAIKNDSIATAMVNGSNIFEDIQNANGQMPHHRPEENVNNGGSGEAPHRTISEKGNEQRQRQQEGQPEREQSHRESLKSAFEQHKARRRNNRRYGHKSHKKRYKDYLRFAMTPTKTTTAIASTPEIIDALPIQNTSQRSLIAAIGAASNRLSATVANGTNGTIGATLAKLTNNSKRNYENKHEMEKTKNFEQYEQTDMQRAEKLKKYAKKIEAEKSREQPASPIFVVANRNSVAAAAARAGPSKPFYEGQINYYMETKDDEQTAIEGGGSNQLQTDTVNWYRRVSPVLRNGIKTSLIDGNETPNEHRRKGHHHHRNHHYGMNSKHHELQHENKHHQNQRHHYNHQHFHHHDYQRKHQQQQQHRHHSHHKHEQTNKHHQSAQSNPYQRKLVKKPTLGNGIASSLYSYSTPIPPPSYKSHAGAMQELGHQITEMEELERYYAKWPHLARVQLQVYDEHFRELHPELYPDYDQDYESAAELEEAQNGNSEDANLPPYIKKYNRRNKQLLNLLEGTLAPPTRPETFGQGQFSSLLQPGPHESSASAVVRIDDDYMKEKRRRYHNRYGNKNNQNNGLQYDLFAEQRAALNANDSIRAQQNSTEIHVTTQKPTAISSTTLPNKIPGEEDDIIARVEHGDPANIDWKEEMKTKSNGNGAEMAGNLQMTWQIEKLTTPSAPIPADADKSPVYRLPSYPAISGSYIGKPRSRIAQFVPSSGRNSNSRGNSFINMHEDYHNLEKTRHMATAMSTVAPESQATESTDTADVSSPSKTINSFVYHRVVDSAPRFVGAGTTGLKQRLPFVAITDRRLETAKKTLMEHKQDLEQNFYPMP